PRSDSTGSPAPARRSRTARPARARASTSRRSGKSGSSSRNLGGRPKTANPLSSGRQKGVRLRPRENALYCEVARRVGLSDHRDRDGFANLVRAALAYYLDDFPDAAARAKAV